MSNSGRLSVLVITLLLGVGVGVGSYQAGVAHGIEQSGGIESAPGKGTEVTVSLPR